MSIAGSNVALGGTITAATIKRSSKHSSGQTFDSRYEPISGGS